MSIDSIAAEYDLPIYIPLKKQRDYGGYQNKTEKMPWFEKDIPFKELSRGLCGYCQVLSTKAVGLRVICQSLLGPYSMKSFTEMEC